MTLLDVIPEGVIVAIDTAPWIYVFEDHPRYAPILRPLFDQRFAKSLNHAGASVLVLAEIIVNPLSLGRQDLVNTYRRFFQDSTRVAAWPVDHAVADLAASLRARHRLKMIDALHLASAIQNGAKVFVCNDTGLRRVTELSVLVLDDYAAPQGNP